MQASIDRGLRVNEAAIDKGVTKGIELTKSDGKRKLDALDDEQCETKNQARVDIDELRKEAHMYVPHKRKRNFILQKTNDVTK